MADRYVLALDVGTQSARAIVFDAGGALVARAQVAFTPYHSAAPGWAEQDVEVYWAALRDSCHTLWNEAGVDPANIEAVSLTTQRGSVVCVDERGEALRPAILWLDKRVQPGLGNVPGPWGWLFRTLGVHETIAQFRADAESNWLQAHQPALWQRTRRFLFLSGYLTHRLTGHFRDSVGCQVGYVPFSYSQQQWAHRWDWKWKAVCVRPDQLPELVPPGQSLGGLTTAAAGELGLPEGLPLVAAAGDKACEVLGSGALSSDVACLGYGTTATINTVSEKYREVIRYLPAYPAAVPGHYNTEIQIFRGFWMVSWFKQEFGAPEEQIAASTGLPTEAVLDQQIRDIPAGSQGLMLQPYWSPGIRDPGPEAKGAIIGFSDVHTRTHVYRAILEGLAYALRHGREKIERTTRQPVRRLRVAGGGSQSDVAMQITADVFGLPAERPHVYEASALGAAINAAVGTGMHPDYRTAVRAMTHVGDVFEPEPAAVRTYDRLYTRVYERMYGRMKPLYRQLRRTTGYPP